MIQFNLQNTALMLCMLDDIAAARDLAQLEQYDEQASVLPNWLLHECSRVVSAVCSVRCSAVEVNWGAGIVLQPKHDRRQETGGTEAPHVLVP